MIHEFHDYLDQVRFGPASKMVRGQRITAFQAAVPDVLGKVGDIGNKRPDTGGEEEQRRHPAVNESRSVSRGSEQENVGGRLKGVELTTSPFPSRA